MANYKCLKQQEYTLGDYSIVPLRYEDRFSIMKWRNEQIYHLRQARPLTEEDQQRYFDNVVAKLFDNPKPDQILFSYLEKGVCVAMVALSISIGLTAMRRYPLLWIPSWRKSILLNIGATI